MDELIRQLKETGLYWSIGNDRLGLTCRIFDKPQDTRRFCIIERGDTLEEAVNTALARWKIEKGK